MKGYPLSRIIDEKIKEENKKESPKIPAIIRDTMGEIETIARFLAPKYLSCYIDLVKQFYEEIDRKDLIKDLIDVNILLEFGVSNKTQISFVSLGLSRTAAITISEHFADDEMNKEKALNWLKHGDWKTMDMPILIKTEIKNLIKERHGTQESE